jgi:ParB family chromosome partitioning protein
VSEPQGDADDDDGLKPLSERLITELTAHRTVALRDALANDPSVAFTAALHALCLGAIDARHQQWAKQLPQDDDDLWPTLVALDSDSQAALFAHCAALSINAVHEPWNRNPQRLAHADALARAVNLDMAAAGWRPTVDNYLGRVPKARILDAVREARGEASAQLIDHLKKPEMAKEAERLLADTGWLPEPLRTTDAQIGGGSAESEASTDALPAFLADAEDGGPEGPTDAEEPSHGGGD